MKQELTLTQEWDKKFPKSEKVNHRKVTFLNRYGIELAADLYMPKVVESKYAAIAVASPYGAVKEQSGGFYAQTLAERGFVTVCFDPSFTGESGGNVRNISSPDINLDYLKTTSFSTEEIAFRLGYEEANTLRRAFHRWTGKGFLEYKNTIINQ